MDEVNKLLNRKWSIEGKVQKGKQLGKKIGFPTANIDIKDYVLACPGVYAVRVKTTNKLKIYKRNSKFRISTHFQRKKNIVRGPFI